LRLETWGLRVEEPSRQSRRAGQLSRQRDFCIEDQLARLDFIAEKIQRTFLAPWVFRYPVSDSITSTFLELPSTSILGAELRAENTDLILASTQDPSGSLTTDH
jgi:hypothetical protein